MLVSSNGGAARRRSDFQMYLLGSLAKRGIMNPMKAPVLRGELLRLNWKLRPAPAEVAAAVEQACSQTRGRSPGWKRKEVEEAFKFQYYFGGEEVAYIPRKQGWDVVAVGEDIKETLAHLPADDRQRVVVAIVDPWPAETLDIATPAFDENTPP